MSSASWTAYHTLITAQNSCSGKIERGGGGRGERETKTRGRET